MKLNTANISSPNFESSKRGIYRKQDGSTYVKEFQVDENDTLIYKNYTHFFRDDLNESPSRESWQEFFKTIDNNFGSDKKVNVYNFACSDGTETYSFISGLINTLGEKKARKFFPVSASDIDSEMIRTAKSGKLDGVKIDLYCMTKNLGKSINNFFSFLQSRYTDFASRQIYPYLICPKDKIKQHANFTTEGFNEGLRRVEPENSLVICRNFWPYLDEKQSEDALRELSSRLKDNSLVVVGRYDKEWGNIHIRLLRHGFEEIANNVYRKITKG